MLSRRMVLLSALAAAVPSPQPGGLDPSHCAAVVVCRLHLGPEGWMSISEAWSGSYMYADGVDHAR